MLHPLDHVLAVILAVLFPLRAALFGFRRLQRCPPDELPALRRRIYGEAIAIQWTLVAATAALWFALGRRAVHLGLEPRLTPGLYGVLAGLALITLLVMRQRAALLKEDAALGALRDRMSRLERMLPHDAGEFRRFRWLATTAGVCEEILYRGYLIWYFVHWMDVIPAAALTSAIFGVGHSYQGLKGVLQTGLLGGFLAGVYLVTGSIYPCILLHALMDLHSGHLMMRAYARRTEQEREAAAESGWVAEGGATGGARESR